jgi:hypothetical protein
MTTSTTSIHARHSHMIPTSTPPGLPIIPALLLQAQDMLAGLWAMLAPAISMAVALLAFLRARKKEDTQALETSLTSAMKLLLFEVKEEIVKRIDAKVEPLSTKEWTREQLALVYQRMEHMEKEIARLDAIATRPLTGSTTMTRGAGGGHQ